MQSNGCEQKYDYFSRSSRIKYMSLKDGKGKIMIGDSYQAKIPSLIQKNESNLIIILEYTIWLL